MKLPRKPYSKYNPTHEMGRETIRHVQEVWEQIQYAFNGNISFGSDATDNIKGMWYSGVTPGVADTEFSIPHNLGYIPTGFLVFNKDQYVDIRKGATAWTSSTIYLKANQTGVNIVLFIC